MGEAFDMARLMILLALVLFGCSALAVDLKNEDSTTYEVKIHDGPSTTHSSIEGNTTKSGICSDCKIEVVGVGTVEASGDKVVIIKNGQLTVE